MCVLCHWLIVKKLYQYKAGTSEGDHAISKWVNLRNEQFNQLPGHGVFHLDIKFQKIPAKVTILYKNHR